MNNYVTLIGAEDVRSAGHATQGAANRMYQAAHGFIEAAERIERALQQHAVEMSELVGRLESLREKR